MTLCWIQCHRRWDPTKMGILWGTISLRSIPHRRHPLSPKESPRFHHKTSHKYSKKWSLLLQLTTSIVCVLLEARDPSHPWSTKIRVLPSIFLPWHIDRTDFVEGCCSYLVQESTWTIACLTISSAFFSSIQYSNPNIIQPTLHSCLFISIHVQ